MPDAVFANNAIVGALAGSYPTGNHFPATVAAVGFKDAAAGEYSLLASSSYKGKGSDGKDLGADMAGLTAAVAGVVK
jgi:hypothetical protein